MNRIAVSIADMMPVIEEKLAAGGEATITVNGTSMSPFFVDGKTRVTLKKPTESLKKYDVILYETDNGTITLHRIVGRKGEYFRTEGDGLRFGEVVASRSVKAVVSSFQNEDRITASDDPQYLRRVRLWHVFRPFRRMLLWWWRRRCKTS
ncbi:MAG: hypothetical protein A2Y16_02035 [Tenericutes bacterium GWF2_57_13]|nr:MAG: hypothetical protein A2Y16_02035 [Tenericutes bacterium GWF2_57_13]